MGMAASQARFLGLTARKTNTEYEGQQINQQRTALGNQSANYYNQLLGMTVPVPPSVDDYTKTVFSFTDGAIKSSLNGMIARADGLFTVSYTSTWNNDFAVVSTAPLIYTKDKTDNTYKVGSVTLRELGDKPDADFIKNDPYLSTLDNGQIERLMKEEEQYITELNRKYGSTGDNTWMVRYVKNTTDNSWKPMFTRLEDLNASTTLYDENTGASLSSIKTYTVGTDVETKEVKNVDARIEQDGSGRIISITLNPDTDQAVTYAVTTTTVTDQDKYNDAMNQYEYDKYQYDQSIQEINAKIEIVQAEDRNLELRLKQLDTEQDAIQTEMAAVQKVIEKNTESTFKTFG